MFINYSNINGLQLSTYRNNGVSCSDDIIDFCKEIQNERACNFSFHESVEYYLDVLCDGSLLDGLTAETVEMVCNALREAE